MLLLQDQMHVTLNPLTTIDLFVVFSKPGQTNEEYHKEGFVLNKHALPNEVCVSFQRSHKRFVKKLHFEISDLKRYI